ncbi:DUF4132 domain-containing protein [Pseudovibrio denitrificans]|uniref:DUF4132 domain-containing protein n=1 Tax=Pseudovibrio denitrificans TaxID=258256 RepID=UPI0039BF80F4
MVWKNLFKINKARKPLQEPSNFSTLVDELLRIVEPRINTEHSLSNLHKLECAAYTKLRSIPADLKPDLLIYLLELLDYWDREATQKRAENDCLQIYSEEKKALILRELHLSIAQTQMSFRLGQLRNLCDQMISAQDKWHTGELFGLVVTKLTAMAKREGLSETQKIEVGEILKIMEPLFFYADEWNVEARLSDLISSKHISTPFSFGNDRTSQILTAFLQGQSETAQNRWHQFFNFCELTKASAPSKSWLEEAERHIHIIGRDKFQKATQDWISRVANLDVLTEWRPWDDELPDALVAQLNFIEPKLFGILQGVCWSQPLFEASNSHAEFTQIAEKSFRWLPRAGPCAGPMGNAAIHALASSNTFSSLLSLASLKSLIKQRKTLDLIDTYVQQNAQKFGLSPAEVEERSVPDFGLVEGKRLEVFDDWRLEITCSPAVRVRTQWIGPTGKAQRKPPQFENQNPALRTKLERTEYLVKQIKRASKVQQKRISNLVTSNMSWSLEELEKLYINHGLVGNLARNLIWVIEDKPVLWISGHWQQVDGEVVMFSDLARVQTWKPDDWSTQDSIAWRNQLEHLGKSQVIKQV